METINGFTIIASQTHERWPDERVILGARPTSDGWTEYVTALARHGAVESWLVGHYFGNPGQPDLENLLLAAADMAERLT